MATIFKSLLQTTVVDSTARRRDTRTHGRLCSGNGHDVSAATEQMLSAAGQAAHRTLAKDLVVVVHALGQTDEIECLPKIAKSSLFKSSLLNWIQIFSNFVLIPAKSFMYIYISLSDYCQGAPTTERYISFKQNHGSRSHYCRLQCSDDIVLHIWGNSRAADAAVEL